VQPVALAKKTTKEREKDSGKLANWFSGFAAVVEYHLFPLLWPLTYTTACNTVQTVILNAYLFRKP